MDNSQNPGACPAYDDIVAFVSGNLSSDRFERIAEHIEQCPSCLPEVESLEDVMDVRLAELLSGADYDNEPELDKALKEIESAEGQAAALASEDRLADQTQLDEYRIVRRIGSGGMGTVYEALQVPLCRRVALKVLATRGDFDPRRLLRFQNEARAAASLQHAHIVPVYNVGFAEGVYYYAMRYVDGQTAAALLQQLSRDANTGVIDAAAARRRLSANHYRRIARWGAEAASALNYAHEMGVLHRDIKLSNLIIASDDSLWLTDFGLARIGAESDLTQTGDLMGTPRYMSPEQALGRRGVVDHRSDIYSLGASLYELAVLEPMIPGDDRHSILQRLAAGESRPPRSINPAVPRDLETIVLKSVAGYPSERYPTAGALGDDLRRFLDGRPILARRLNLGDKVLRWLRRHALLVTGCLLALIAVSLALVAFLIAIARERNRAQNNFQTARRAVDEMLTEVGESDLAELPHMEPARVRLLEKALTFYRQFLADPEEKDSAVRLETGRAYRRVSHILLLLGRTAEAQQQAKESIRFIESLCREDPRDPVRISELAKAYEESAAALFRTRETTIHESIEARQHEIALREKLAAMLPDQLERKAELAATRVHLANALLQGDRLFEAQTEFRAAQAAWNDVVARDSRYRMDERLAHADHWIGSFFVRMENWKEAESNLRESLRIREYLVSRNTGHEQRALLAHLQVTLSQLLIATDRPDEAERQLREALRVLQSLARDYPAAYEYAKRLNHCYSELAVALAAQHRFADAEAAYQVAWQTRADNARRFPDVEVDPSESGWLKYDLGNTQFAAGKKAAAAESFVSARQSFEVAVKQFPNNPREKYYLANFLCHVPLVSLREPNRAIELGRQAVAVSPERRNWRVLGAAYVRAGRNAEGIEALSKAAALGKAVDLEEQFLLAIALARQGKTGPARLAYDAALSSVHSKNAWNSEKEALRFDAAAAIGIKR